MTILIILGFVFAFLFLFQLKVRIEDLEKQVTSLRLDLNRESRKPQPEAPKEEHEPEPEVPEPPAVAPKEEKPSPLKAAKEAAANETAAKEAATSSSPTETTSPTPPPLPKKKTASPATSPPATEVRAQPVTPTAPATPTPPAPAIPAFEWKPLLEKLKLWPPSGESAEAAIAGWWLTRIGLILFIISAVFFGIRIAEDVPPWLRISCLAGIATAVLALGTWLERRLQAFGRLIAAGGLSLFYFTAFAAYALPATKVIPDALPALGVLVQVATLALMIAWSLWKRDEPIAAVGILLGYVSCWFSQHHDLDHFVILGLLLLAAGGGVMLNLRAWLIPHAVATAGSWLGFLLLAGLEWNHGNAPEFPLMLGSLLALTLLLEIANFLAAERFQDRKETYPLWRRSLAVYSTTAAILTGYLATRFAYPERLSDFYLAFSLLLLTFSAARFARNHHKGLTETYFLKGSALLALFLVAEFDGPVRWLSLSIQSAAMLWTWRRSRYLWVEIGFAAIFVTVLCSIGYDIHHHELDTWKALDVFHLIGALSLTILSAVLALHGHWAPSVEKPQETSPNAPPDIDARWFLRSVAAAIVGILAALLMFQPDVAQAGLNQSFALSVLALILMLPALLFRQSPPFLAGYVALAPAYFAFFASTNFHGSDQNPLLIGFWLIAIGFALPELIHGLWPSHWKFASFFRATLHGFAVITVGVTFTRQVDIHDLEMPLSLLALFLTAGAGAIALAFQCQPSFGPEGKQASIPDRIWQWLLAVAIGFITLPVALETLQKETYLPVFFALAAAILVAATFRTRNAAPALAGLIPYLAALVSYLLEFDSHDELRTHLICAASFVAISATMAALAWKLIDARKYPVALFAEAFLHCASLLVLHWFFRSQLDTPGQVIFADIATATALILLSYRSPFHTLRAVTGVSIGLAIIYSGITQRTAPGPEIWWWASSGLVLGWLWISVQFLKEEKTGKGTLAPVSNALTVLNEALAAIALTAISLRVLASPWEAVALAGFAFVLAIMGRGKAFPSVQWWSLIPLCLAIFDTYFEISISGFPGEQGQTPALIAISLTCLLAIGHGVALTWRRPHFRPITWFHAVASLGIFFYACASSYLDIQSWATVCWGIAAIAVFVTGLIAGLRPYRLGGLIGLSLCLARMFLIDIEDPLYRIYAFFAISVVLLLIGYLYHRFRHFIEAADRE